MKNIATHPIGILCLYSSINNGYPIFSWEEK